MWGPSKNKLQRAPSSVEPRSGFFGVNRRKWDKRPKSWAWSSSEDVSVRAVTEPVNGYSKRAPVTNVSCE